MIIGSNSLALAYRSHWMVETPELDIEEIRIPHTTICHGGLLFTVLFSFFSTLDTVDAVLQ